MIQRDCEEGRELQHEQRRLLRAYLRRFRRCRGNERRLAERQMMISEYRAAGMKGKACDGTGGSGAGRSDSTVALIIECEGIEERVEQQKAESVRVLNSIIEILDFLPEGSDERDVLERKYIDLQAEAKICRELAISRSKLYKDATRGIDTLLTYAKVQQIVKEMQNEQDEL